MSYNRNEYDKKNIFLDDMTFREFLRFKDEDKVNCMSIEVTHIFNTTQFICGASKECDDSVYWFISADLAQLEEYKNFFCKYKLK